MMRKTWSEGMTEYADILKYGDHKHEWEKAATTEKKMDGHPIDFWICLGCGKVSPGPTDNEALDPRRSD